MNLKLTWLCLLTALLAGCETTDSGVVLCRRSEVKYDGEGVIFDRPARTTQTKYKAGDLPTLFVEGCGGKHVRIEVVNSAGQVVQEKEGDVPRSTLIYRQESGTTGGSQESLNTDRVRTADAVGLRRSDIVLPLNVAESGSYTARLLVNGELSQTVAFEVEW